MSLPVSRVGVERLSVILKGRPKAARLLRQPSKIIECRSITGSQFGSLEEGGPCLLRISTDK